MTKFEVDSYNFITDCVFDDDVIIIPSDIKGIRSFSFLDLPVKRIIFEGRNIEIEEQAFVNLENLEVIDMRSMDLKSCLNIEDALSDTPPDVCLIVDNDEMVEPLINNSKFLNVFVKADVYDPDFGYNNPRWWANIKLKRAISAKKIFLRCPQCVNYTQSISGIYFPDYIDGKEVIIDDFSLVRNFFEAFEGACSIKFPKLDIYSFDFTGFSLSCCKRVHLSRLDERLPINFMELGVLNSLYIPKNFKELNGLRKQTNIKNVIIQDEKNIESIDAYFLEESLFMKNFFNNYKDYKKNNGIFVWKDFAMGVISNEEVLKIPNNVRIIANGFLPHYVARKKNIGKVILGENVEFIGDDAFKYCDTIKEVDFNDKLKLIGKYAFFNSQIESIKLPNSLVKVGDSAFAVEFYDSEEEASFKRKKVSYPSHTKLGNNCFDVNYDALPFN